MASSSEKEEDFESGKVNRVRRDFGVLEDGELAQRLQEDEYDRHYHLNKRERQTVGQGVKTAKEIFVDEVRQAGIIAEQDLDQLQSDEWLASELETKIQQEERKQIEQQVKDEELAKHLQEEEALELERTQAMRRDKQQELETRELTKLQQAIMGLHMEPHQSGSSSAEADIGAVPTEASEPGTSEETTETLDDMGVRIGLNRFILADGTEVQLSDDEREKESAARRHCERRDESSPSPTQVVIPKKPGTPKSVEDHRIAMEMQDREIAKFLQRRELYRLEKQREMQLRRAQSVPEGRMGTNGDEKSQKSEYKRRGTEPRRRLPTYEEAMYTDEPPENDCDCERPPQQDLSTTDIDTCSIRSEQVASGDTAHLRRVARNRSNSPREGSASPREVRRRSPRNASPSLPHHTVNGEARISPRDNLSRTSSSSSSRSDRDRDPEFIRNEQCGHFHRHQSNSPATRRSTSPAVRRSVSPGSRQNGARTPDEHCMNSEHRHRCRKQHSTECQIHSHESPSGHCHVHRKSSQDRGSDSDEFARVGVGRRPSFDPDSDTESQRNGHRHRRRSSPRQKSDIEDENHNGLDRELGHRRSGNRGNEYEEGGHLRRRTSSQGSDVGYESQGHLRDPNRYVESPSLRRDKETSKSKELYARRAAENRNRAETMDSPKVRERYIAMARSRDQREGKVANDQANISDSQHSTRSNSCSKIRKDDIGARLSNREAEAILRRTQREDAAEQMRMTRTQSEFIRPQREHDDVSLSSVQNGDDASLHEMPLYLQNGTNRSTRHTINIAECIDPTFQRRKTEDRVSAPVVRNIPPPIHPEPYPEDDDPPREAVGRPAPVIQASKRRSSESKKKRDGCKTQ